MKVFCVTVSKDLYVRAETLEEAEKIAADNVAEESRKKTASRGKRQVGK